ncbi:MAG: hypothetical protein R2736_00265 [Solirubrobacterales bacterium]
MVLRPVIERLRAAGHEVQITARDFAQTLGLLERYELGHTAIGAIRARGWRPRRAAWRRDRARSSAGRGGAARSTSPSATAPTTSWSPRRCCASRARRCSTTSGRRCSTRSTAAWRGWWWCRTRSRPSAWRATAPAARSARTRG